jgi:HSP20 family protein
MTIVRWHSFPDMAAREEQMSRMLSGFYGRPQEDLTHGAWVPAVDIYSNGQHELVLKAELPDMKQEEIELTVEDNTLTLRGEKKLDMDVTPEQFHRSERSHGSFARTFGLPPTVDAGQVRAE